MTWNTPGWRAIAAFACLITAPAVCAAAQTSAQSSFRRGVTALHDFEYEEANEAFREARAIDPGFVMACWGEAMTYHQTLWRNENVQAGRDALAQCGPTPQARAAKASTATERMFLAAVESLFGGGDAETRRRQYAVLMGRLYARAPDDPDIASFYALALLGTMSRGLIGYIDPHEGHSLSLAGSDTQAQVNAILQKVLRAHPAHLGALHYLLHNNDDPEHATEALPAARALARLAPDSSHVLHMPAHIFLQLGAWQDAASSDSAAFKASDAWVTRKGLPAALRSYHALSWMEYELLQLGRYREARATLDEIEPVVKAGGQLTLLSTLSTMRARYVVETSNWVLMARGSTFGNADELFAIGMSAARSGDAAAADRARQALASRVQDEREGDLRPAIAIMEREIAALTSFAAGRRDEAVTILKAAARSELQLPAPLGLPEPIKPAPELLGELLIEVGRPQEAAPLFRQALARNANRSLSILGLARAAAASGDTANAGSHYRQLLANFSGADPELDALNEARSALAAGTHASTPGSASRSGWNASALIAPAVALATAGAAAALVQQRARRRRARKKRGPPVRAPVNQRRAEVNGRRAPASTVSTRSPAG